MFEVDEPRTINECLVFAWANLESQDLEPQDDQLMQRFDSQKEKESSSPTLRALYKSTVTDYESVQSYHEIQAA